MKSAADSGSPSLPSPSGGEAIEPPADLGEIFIRTFSAVKRRFWTLFGINLVGAIANTFSMVVVSGMFRFELQSLKHEALDQQEKWTLILPANLVVIPLVLFVSQIVVAKVAFVSFAGADRLLAGERPNFSEMWRGSSGSLRRSIPLLILLTLFWTLFRFAFVVLWSQAYQPGASITRGLGVAYVFTVAVVLLMLYFSIRWIYSGQLITLEKVSSIEPLPRSWALTSEEFWRTLGYLFVGYLIVSVVSEIAPLFGAGPKPSSGDHLDAVIEPFRSGEVMGVLIAILVSMSTAMVLQTIVTVLVEAITSACTWVYITSMYRDQRYRDSLKERGIDPKRVTTME